MIHCVKRAEFYSTMPPRRASRRDRADSFGAKLNRVGCDAAEVEPFETTSHLSGEVMAQKKGPDGFAFEDGAKFTHSGNFKRERSARYGRQIKIDRPLSSVGTRHRRMGRGILKRTEP